jgi:glycosyltransferase involved in cell wall biosynthesis
MSALRPTVSVLMLCMNEAVFIRRAIRSVLMQSFSGPIEVVLVDDGSSDDSAGIVREEVRLAGRHNLTLNVVTNPVTTGNAQAFVAGLQAARGKYYHVLDCDDYWIDPDKLQIQVSALQGHPDFAGVAHRTIVRNQLDQSESFHPEHEPLKPVLTFEDLAVEGIYFHTSAMLYRNDFYDADSDTVKIPPIFTEVRGDTVRLYVHASAGPILYIAQSMSVYDDHGGGIWTSLDWPSKQVLLRNLYDKLQRRGYLAGMGERNATAYLTKRLTEIAAYTPAALRPVSLYSAQVAALPRYRLSNISHIGNLRDMEIQMNTLVEALQYEDALQLLQRLVTAISYDPNLSKQGQRRRIASFEVDWQCTRLGESIGRKYDVLPAEPCGDSEGPIVFVVSGVVDDLEGLWDETMDILALHRGSRKICVMSTEMLPSDAALRDALRAEGIQVMCNSDTLLEDKTAWVMWHLTKQKASQIFVNPARNDVALAAALHRNHAEHIHVLTALGSGFALCRLSEVVDGFVARRPYDLAYYDKIAPGHEVVYIPAYPRAGPAEPRAVLTETPVVTVTVCKDSRSIEQVYDYSFDRAIPAVLNSGSTRHIHVGAISEATVNRIRKGLAQNGLSHDLFEVHPWPEDVTTYLRDCGATLFLQAFPLPEQRPMLSALAAGLPVILHYGYLHPMLAMDDICYPGAPVWGTIGELAAIMRKVDTDWMVDQSSRLEAHLASFGSVEAVLAQLGDDLMKPAAAELIPAVQIPETHHELRRILTELMTMTIFRG